MLPKLIKTKRPTIVWDIYIGPIEHIACPNPTGGDQQKKESRDDITFSH